MNIFSPFSTRCPVPLCKGFVQHIVYPVEPQWCELVEIESSEVRLPFFPFKDGFEQLACQSVVSSPTNVLVRKFSSARSSQWVVFIHCVQVEGQKAADGNVRSRQCRQQR